MKISDYIFTPKDFYLHLRRVSLLRLGGVVVSVIAFIILLRIFSFDFSFLVFGLLLMTLANLSFKLPLSIAVLGLLSLMAMSPLVEQENQWESLSESVAVLVFFMLVFGVYKMILNEILESLGIGVKENSKNNFKPSNFKHPLIHKPKKNTASKRSTVKFTPPKKNIQ